jgi:hypothetical protein
VLDISSGASIELAESNIVVLEDALFLALLAHWLHLRGRASCAKLLLVVVDDVQNKLDTF